MPKRIFTSCRARGFTLVEVVLAMGIFSFSVVTVMGLLSVGLVTMKDAMEQTTESQILQKINGLVLLTPYSSLSTTISGQTFYYDADGAYLGSTPGAAPAKTHFSVTMTLVSPIFPGSVNSPSSVTSSLSTIRMKIVSAPTTGAAVKTTHTYVVEVPNSGN